MLSHKNARLNWMAYVGGTRETLQLLGDVILTEEDITSKKPFDDGCVLTTWSVDLHYPNEQYEKKFEENPFISVAVHGKAVDRKKGYPVPYRCFYSRNIENLFMAGRNISVTHEALGTVRVMKTCGMMGVVVGKAAAICVKHNVSPREVYYQHLDELIALLQIPGNMRRATIADDFAVDPALPVFAEEVAIASPRASSRASSSTMIRPNSSGNGLTEKVSKTMLKMATDTSAPPRWERQTPAPPLLNSASPKTANTKSAFPTRPMRTAPQKHR